MIDSSGIKIVLLGSLLALSTAVAAVAMCMASERSRVATVTVETCTDLPTYAARKLESTELGWVALLVANVVENNHGVVLKGTVTQKLYVEQFSRTEFELLESVLVDESGEWFVRLERKGSCDDYPVGSEVELFMWQKCCDVLPPGGVPCALDTGAASLIPKPLKRLL